MKLLRCSILPWALIAVVWVLAVVFALTCRHEAASIPHSHAYEELSPDAPLSE